MPPGGRDHFTLAGRVCLATLALLTAGTSAAYVLGDPAHFHPVFRARYTEHLSLVRSHGVPAVVVLALGPLLLSARLRLAAPALHRVLGRVYLLGVLVAGLSGLLLAGTSDAGEVARSGFYTMAVLWLATAAVALVAARQGRWELHRRFMTRNFALTFGAVTLRLYLNGLGGLGFCYEDVYPWIAWLAWVPNLLVAELLLAQGGRASANRSTGGVGDART